MITRARKTTAYNNNSDRDNLNLLPPPPRRYIYIFQRYIRSRTFYTFSTRIRIYFNFSSAPRFATRRGGGDIIARNVHSHTHTHTHALVHSSEGCGAFFCFSNLLYRCSRYTYSLRTHDAVTHNNDGPRKHV